MQASDDKTEGKSIKSLRQKLLEDLHKKYCCFGGAGAKSDGQVCHVFTASLGRKAARFDDRVMVSFLDGVLDHVIICSLLQQSSLCLLCR